jgi:hypothetical protein
MTPVVGIQQKLPLSFNPPTTLLPLGTTAAGSAVLRSSSSISMALSAGEISRRVRL